MLTHNGLYYPYLWPFVFSAERAMGMRAECLLYKRYVCCVSNASYGGLAGERAVWNSETKTHYCEYYCV